MVASVLVVPAMDARSMYASMQVCKCASMQVCKYACMHVSMVCVVRARACVRACVCVCACVCACVRARVRVRTGMCARAQTRIRLPYLACSTTLRNALSGCFSFEFVTHWRSFAQSTPRWLEVSSCRIECPAGQSINSRIGSPAELHLPSHSSSSWSIRASNLLTPGPRNRAFGDRSSPPCFRDDVESPCNSHRAAWLVHRWWSGYGAHLDRILHEAWVSPKSGRGSR